MSHKRVTESFQIHKNAMVENTNEYLEKTEIEGFGGNLFLYKRLENANADSKDIWHYRAKIVGMKGYVRSNTKETNFALAKRYELD